MCALCSDFFSFAVLLLFLPPSLTLLRTLTPTNMPSESYTGVMVAKPLLITRHSRFASPTCSLSLFGSLCSQRTTTVNPTKSPRPVPTRRVTTTALATTEEGLRMTTRTIVSHENSLARTSPLASFNGSDTVRDLQTRTTTDRTITRTRTVATVSLCRSEQSHPVRLTSIMQTTSLATDTLPTPAPMDPVGPRRSRSTT